MAYARVPRDHVHIVALLDEKVGYASGTNDFYRKAFGADNPNLALIHALKKVGGSCWSAARAWPRTVFPMARSIRT